MKLLDNNRGQGLVEYGLILILIAALVVLVVKGIGSEAHNKYSTVNSAVGSASQ